MHDPTEKGMAAVIALLVAWKGWEILKPIFTGTGKLLDSTNARRKIAADAEAARAKVEADALAAHEKVVAETQGQRDTRLDLKTWEFVGRLETRLDKVEAKLATEEEARRVANVFADVATERADDLQEKLREAEADRSLLRLQIIQLNREATERDAKDRMANAEHEQHLNELYDLLKIANEEIASLRKQMDGSPLH